MSIPVVAIVGRPNVGKSTLFNRFTRSQDAIVADVPGVTRDRLYGEGQFHKRRFIVIDTGGLGSEQNDVDDLMVEQVEHALEQAHCIVFIVDAQQGITPGDEQIADRLRALGKPVILTVNKSESQPDEALALAPFYELGFEHLIAISASHAQNTQRLLQTVSKFWPDHTEYETTFEQPGVKITFIGRPNTGKSTLMNRLLGEQRVITYDAGGTTRDVIAVPFDRDDQHYVLIDTAGVRRRKQVKQTVEKLSVVKTLQSIEYADVVVLVLDARQDIASQDLKLLDFVMQSGRSLVIAVNKWDHLSRYQRQWIKRELDRRLSFADFSRMHFISALYGTGVGELFQSIDEAYASANAEMTTSQLTDILLEAVANHPPPLMKGRRIKLRYAHPGGHLPPRIVIHGKQTSRLPEDYKRYLLNYFRRKLNLTGTPIKLFFKTDSNPYQ